jgi:SAM-dependent methyltransferase
VGLREAEYANYFELDSPAYFMITRDIFEIENELHRIPNSNYHIAGSGEQPDFVVMSDSLHNTRRFEYPWVTRRLPKGINNLLDVGGSSSWTLYASQRVPYVVVVDIDPKVKEMHDRIRHYTGKFNNIRSITADWLDNKLPNALFDCSVSISTIEHMGKNTLSRAMSELRRVTKPDGTIIVTMDFDLLETPSIPKALVTEELAKLGIVEKDIVGWNASVLGNKLPNGVIGVICVSFKNNEV